MFIILHCRVLLLLHYLCLPYPFWCICLLNLLGDTSFLYSLHWLTLMQCLFAFIELVHTCTAHCRAHV